MTGVLIGRRRDDRDVRHRGQTMWGRAALSKPRREGGPSIAKLDFQHQEL